MLKWPLGLMLIASLGSADTVYLRGAGGKWLSVPGKRQGASLSVTVSPSQTDAGRAILVLSKPPWMVLDDTTAPVLKSLATGGAPVKVGERLDLRATGKGPVLEATFEDDANPVLATSVAATLGGQVIHAEAKPGAPAKRATVTLNLSTLAPGAYDGFLEAADMSPLANTLRVPVHLAVDGIRRHSDGQTVTVCAGGQEYVVGGPGTGQGFVRLGPTGASAYLSTSVSGKFVYARNITAIEDIPNGARLVADVIGIENKDFGQIARLEFDVSTDPDFAGVLVTSRAVNLDADGPVYCFWGWLPGASYATADGDHAWKMAYANVGKVGWVFLRPTQPGKPGIGLISPLVFGESRFGTMLLYTDPTNIQTKRGDAIEMKLAFMLADDPQAVAAACGALKAKKWLP